MQDIIPITELLCKYYSDTTTVGSVEQVIGRPVWELRHSSVISWRHLNGNDEMMSFKWVAVGQIVGNSGKYQSIRCTDYYVEVE